MSWSYQRSGRASALAEVVKQQFVDTHGCPKGSAEEVAKNQLGDVVETLCRSLPADKVVTISASASAWNNSDGGANSQHLKVEFVTHGEFVE